MSEISFRWIILSISLYSLLHYVFTFRYAWRSDTKVFPYQVFPKQAKVDNGDNDGQILEEYTEEDNNTNDATKCIQSWIGNMRCDKQNNKQQCKWDGGDCCLSTCLKVCETKNYTDSQCPCRNYKFDCKDPKADCKPEFCNTTNAKCQPQSKCLVGERTDPTYHTIRLLEVCMVLPWAMGNLQTINKFCGKDPLKTTVHDNTPGLHFPGCGMTQDQCTTLPCCDDALRYGFRNGTCNDTVMRLNLFSEATYSTTDQNTDCLSYFETCFKKVMKDKGQCCECFKGWAGFDCNTPVCSPPCVHGNCTAPDTCKCETGWTGLICSIGICTSCKYGVCKAPEQCECFYGYEGADCNTPVSDPPCVHGKPTKPNICQCDLGWTGPICDVPECPQGCGHGYCVDAQVCECYNGYFTSFEKLPQECDAIDCKSFHPQCIKCNDTHCNECNDQFVLNANQKTCHSCKELYGPLCIDCDQFVCKECYWPYKYDITTKKCLTNGMLEFSIPHLFVRETQYAYTVIVRRAFETKGRVTVDYELQNTKEYYSRIEDTRGTLIFDDGVEEQSITFRIFKRHFYEQDDYLSTFKLELYNPSLNTELGDIPKMVIYYYDDETIMNDASVTDMAVNNTYNVSKTHNLPIGWTNTFNIRSYNDFNNPKILGNDLFIARFLYQNGTEAEILTSKHISNELYNIDFIVKSMEIAVAKIFVTSKGFYMRYYDNTNFLSTPYIERIEDHLPFWFTNEMRRMDYFSVRMEAFLNFKVPSPSPNQKEDVKFYVALGEEDSAKIFFGTDLVFETEPYLCQGSFNSSFDRCCMKKKTFVIRNVDLTGQIPYYLRIDYKHKENEPCIGIWRESTSLAKDDIRQNAYSMTELRASPYFIKPLISVELIAIQSTTLEIDKFKDTNTKQYIGPMSLQATISNLLLIHPRDIYYNVITELDDLKFVAELNDGVNIITGISKFHFVKKRYEIFITPKVATPHGVLTIKSNGQDIQGSPFAIDIVPGPYSLYHTDWLIWNGDGVTICLVNTICSVKILLRDIERNLVTTEYMFSNIDVDVVLRGPFSARHTDETLYISEIDNSESAQGVYYIKYKRYFTGLYFIYIRIRGDHYTKIDPLDPAEPSYYPLKFMVTTKFISPDKTFIISTNYESQVAGVPFTFQVRAIDAFGNYVETGTDDFKVLFINRNDTTITASQDSFIYLTDGVYEFTSTLFKIGYYSFDIKVKDLNDGNYVKIKGCPYYLWVYPNEPSATLSTVTGSGVTKVNIGRIEQVNLQVKDIYDNNYHQKEFMGQPVYSVSVVCNTTDNIPINLTSSNPKIGDFKFIYRLLAYYLEAQVTIQIYSKNIDTGVYEYQNIVGSVFTVPVGFMDLELYESENDLSMTGFGVTKLSYIFLIPPVVMAGETFQMRLYPRNGQGANFVYIEQDGVYFLLEFTPLIASDGTGLQTQCNCRPAFQRFCSFFSYSKAECEKLPACTWIHENSASNFKPSYGSCAPCSNGCFDMNLKGVPQPYFNPRMNNYQFLQTNDNMFYYFDTSLQIASHYLLTVAAFRIGQLTVTLYEQDDFTQYMYTFNIPRLNLTLDQDLHTFFKDRDQGYSLTIQGMVRVDYSNLYNITVITNKDVKIYFDQQLVFDKPAEVKDTHSFQIELFSHKMMHFQVFLSDKEREIEQNGTRGYFTMLEECGNTKRRLWRPKNIFQFQHIIGSNEQKIRVDADYASLANSYVFERNKELMPSLNNSVFRAGKTFSFELIVKDQFENLRGIGYFDVVEMNVTLNGTVESSINLVNQDSGHYQTTYQFKRIGLYRVYFYLNGFQMPEVFTFFCKNGLLDPKFTEILTLGYLNIAEMDCVFVRRPFYVIFTMFDEFNNTISYADREAFVPVIAATLTRGIFYDNEKCQRYTLDSDNIVICQFEPLEPKDDQVLTIYRADTNDNFLGFPMSLSVEPYKQEGFKSNSINAIEKFSEKDLSESSQILRVTLSFIAKDIYGNLMHWDDMCSYFAHTRFILQFNAIYANPQPQKLASSIVAVIEEDFDSEKNLKSYKLEVQYPLTLTFDAVFLNYTLYDGLNYKNGLLIKYYTNNNFQGKPLLIARIPSSFIASDAYQSTWYQFHRELKDFSVKMTTLMFIPPSSGRHLTFVTGLSNRFQLLVNDQLVIGYRQLAGSIDLQGDGIWIKVTMLYQMTNNNMAGVSQFLVQWQSENLSLQYLENSATGTVVIAMDPNDLDEPILYKDYFKVARTNFLISSPVEASFPSTTHITVSWNLISEAAAAAEEKIIYYSLEWDQGPVKEWVELTTPGVLVNSFTLNSGFSSGITYNFRVRAKDLIGYGPYSTVLSVVPKALPDKPGIPITEIDGTNVKISWDEPNGNGAAVIKYRIYVQKKDGSFRLEDTYCNENSIQVSQERYCLIPMDELTGPLYQLVKYDKIIAKVQAGTFIGFGDISDPNSSGALAEEVPLVTGTPWRGSKTSHLILHVVWPPIASFSTFSGGLTTEIVSYNLQWDHGDPIANEWYDLKGYTINDANSEFWTNSEIVGGTWYRVRVRAKNKYGWGPFSPIIRIICALAPSPTNKITTIQDYQSVLLMWDKPSINGLEITEYEVLFKDKDGNYAPTASCLGNNAIIIKNLQCRVSFLTFRNDFQLILNDLIVVKIRAYNAYGWGAYAENTDGVLVKTEPQKPPVKIKRGLDTNEVRIVIGWQQLFGDLTGREQILSYEIYWDNGTGGTTWEELHIARTPFSYVIYEIDYPMVLAGQRYRFIYRATNQQGTGPFSDYNEIIAADYPDQCAPVVTQNVGLDVVISWSPSPFDHASAVFKYRLVFKNQLGMSYELLSYCDGADPVIFAALSCTIPMSAFKTGNFDLQIGDLIIVWVEAGNEVGYSIQSVENTGGAKFQAKPQVAPINLVGIPPTKYSVKITWDSINTSPDNGGLTPDYKVLWNQGPSINTWTTLATSTSGNTQFSIGGFTPGTAYDFKVVAFNIFGEGPESSVVQVITAVAPSGVTPPTTTYELSTKSVLIEWSPPSDDGGLPTLTYQLEVEDVDGNLQIVDQNAECDTAIIPLPTANLGCRMLVSTFIDTKYRLKSRSVITARIFVSHSHGGTYSAIGGTAILITDPSGLSAPTTEFDIPTDSAVVKWDLPLDDGGLTALTYTLELQDINSNWVTVDQSTECDTVVSPLAPGQLGCRLLSSTMKGARYSLKSYSPLIARVTATQDFGNTMSPAGGSALMKTGPLGEAAPTTTLDLSTKSVLIQWDKPLDDGGIQAITYSIEIKDVDNNWISVDQPNECITTMPVVDPLLFECRVLLTTLISARYRLLKDNVVLSRVTATQSLGSVISSEGGSAVIKTLPSGLSSPTTTFEISQKAVLISWDPPLDDGGLSGLTYELEIQDVDSNWVTVDQVNECTMTTDVASPMFTCTITVATLQNSLNYRLGANSQIVARVTATQEIGSVISNQGGLAIIKVPPSGQPAPTSSFDYSTHLATISWDPPTQDGGISEPTLTYAIELLDINSQWVIVDQTLECILTDSPVSPMHSCTMLLDDLLSVRYSLTKNSLIYARITATTLMGSTQNEGGSAMIKLVPSGMAAPTTSFDTSTKSALILWDLPSDDGGLNAITYQLEIKTSSLSWEIVDQTNECDTSIAPLAPSQLGCRLLLSTLRGAKYGLTSRSNLIAKVTATQAMGSVTSPEGGDAIILTEPIGLAAPSSLFDIPSQSALISWTVPSDDGGITSLNYVLEVKDIDSAWQTVDQATECDVSSPVAPPLECRLLLTTLTDTKYRLLARSTVVARVTASQIMGSVTSAQGGIAIVLTAPSGLNNPTTTMDEVTKSVLVLWDKPSEDGGIPSLTYTLELKDSSDAWVTVDQSTQCDTAVAPLDPAQLGCRLLVTTLTSSPYSLIARTTISARVTATQSMGSTSASGGSAILLTEPSGLSAPLTTYDSTSLAMPSVLIQWTAPANDGGYSSITYKLEVQAFDSSWIEVDQATECDTSAAVVDPAYMECRMLESLLRDTRYNLIDLSFVVARVIATQGMGSVTSANGGSAVLPAPPPPPPTPPPDPPAPSPPDPPAPPVL